MELKITGTVKQLLEEQSGEGKNGTWRKQEFILETDGNYPKQICIVMWGENIDQFAITPEERIVASIDIQSREYNSRWYTDVKAWKVEREGSDGGAGGNAPPVRSGEPFPEPPDTDDEDDGLPF
jgi:hypothetical protein